MWTTQAQTMRRAQGWERRQTLSIAPHRLLKQLHIHPAFACLVVAFESMLRDCERFAARFAGRGLGR